MGKHNPYLLLRMAEKEIRMLQDNLLLAKGLTIQQCLDMAMIALNEEFGFGPVYNRRFEKRFRQVFVEFASLCVDDGKDDEDIWYTKGVLDRRLRDVAGEEMLPFDDRYARERLYLRDTREAWQTMPERKDV